MRNWEGIEALAKPIFVRGVSPFNGWLPCALFIQNGFTRLVALRGLGAAGLKEGKPPTAIGKANAPTPKTSDSKFDSLRGKMLPHFILPESLIL